MRVVLLMALDDYDTPIPDYEDILDADLIVTRDRAGLWSIWKYRYGPPMKHLPWDDLPSLVKRALPLYPRP